MLFLILVLQFHLLVNVCVCGGDRRVCVHLNWDSITDTHIDTHYGPVISFCNYSKNTVYPNFLIVHLLFLSRRLQQRVTWKTAQSKIHHVGKLKSKSVCGTSVQFFTELTAFLQASLNLVCVHRADLLVCLLSTSVQPFCILYYSRFCKYQQK